MTSGRDDTTTIAFAFTGLVAVVVIAAACSRGGAQDAPMPTGPDRRGVARPDSAVKTLDELHEAAGTYDIRLATDPPTRLHLHSEPVLLWTNPVRRGGNGAVFLWVADGRPEAVASFYQFKLNGMLNEDHEFQSLAFTALTAMKDGREVWFPTGPGVTLTAISGAPAPANVPAERQRQLRTLASHFKAFVDSPTNPSELRLLAKPLYRYETDRADRPDGALFAFVQATDPEVLLLIESGAQDGAIVWRYGLARMSMARLRAEFKGEVVWRAVGDENRFAPNKTYMTLRVRQVPINERPVGNNP
jgi:hypothetical protein